MKRTSTKIRVKSSRKLLYEQYLISDHWNVLRLSCKDRDETCRAKHSSECRGSLQAHHMLYRDCFTETELKDLVLLCSRHHRLVHRLVAKKKLGLSEATNGVLWGKHRCFSDSSKPFPFPDSHISREIEEGRSENGGWTKKQLAEWGVPWPPPKGWKEKLIVEGFKPPVKAVKITPAKRAKTPKKPKSITCSGCHRVHPLPYPFVRCICKRLLP